MLVLRSVAFNISFYLNLVLHIILALPTFALPRAAFMALARSWGRTSNLLLRVIAGISVEFRGLEKIPPGALFGNLSLGPEGHGAILGLIVLVAAVTAGMARLTVQRTLRSME